MDAVVIGATLADAQEFCRRNPDFADARRASIRSYVKYGAVHSMVLTPAALEVQGGWRHNLVRHARVLARCVTKTWAGERLE